MQGNEGWMYDTIEVRSTPLQPKLEEDRVLFPLVDIGSHPKLRWK